MIVGYKFVRWLSTVFLFLAGTGWTISTAYAQTNSLQTRIIQPSLAANPYVNRTQPYSSDLNQQIKLLDDDIQYSQQTINTTADNLTRAFLEFGRLQNLQIILSENINKRSSVLKSHALTYQQNGNNKNYMEVFFNTGSFHDFIVKISAEAMISKGDRDLINQQKKDLKNKKNISAALVKQAIFLKNMTTEFHGMQAQLEKLNHRLKILKQRLENRTQEVLAKRKQKQLTIVKTETPKRTSVFHVVHNVLNANQGYIKTIINAGYKYIGRSTYVFGGGRTAYDIANGRFDCSGFVHWAFSQAGITVGFSTDTIKTAGHEISANNMQPGDLVFFDTYKKDGHVGIYIGNGKFIGSQCSKGVVIEDMTTGYWKDAFKGHVVRI